MNNNITLCEILKGHEGEIFYSVALGYIKLHKITENTLVILALKHNSIEFEVNAKEIASDLFPSNDQRDWNKFIKEQNLKGPKTWSELIKEDKFKCNHIEIKKGFYSEDKSLCGRTPIEKSALALLKINQLIEVGYSGNITKYEWFNYDNYIYTIEYDGENKIYKIIITTYYKSHIAFHTKKQAEEFLKYPENVQLLKDYFMIN